MNTYVTGAAIRRLRERGNMTQSELGEKIGVSSQDHRRSRWLALAL